MLNFIQNEKLESLVRCGVVTDEHITNYLQGIEYGKWEETQKIEWGVAHPDGDISFEEYMTQTAPTVMGQNPDGTAIIIEKLIREYVPTDLTLQVAQWKLDNKVLKYIGEDFNGYLVPYQNEDAMALLQVKALFDMGGTSTHIHFSNGTVYPINSLAEFTSLATWFVQKRNSLFI